jgi:hypothetical protein
MLFRNKPLTPLPVEDIIARTVASVPASKRRCTRFRFTGQPSLRRTV